MNDLVKRICPDEDEQCLKELKEACPDLDPECLSQMDYALIGKENMTKTTDKKYFDVPYLNLCEEIIENGTWEYNERTKKQCLKVFGRMLKFDLSNTKKFPILTTKKLFVKPMIAELLGFLRACDNAKDFRELGCNFWNANANESGDWLNNPNRRGEDDLGRIYGVQARKWNSINSGEIDQLKMCVENIQERHDNRRLLVSHWNPGELHQMALPPCHVLYQFNILNDKLNLALYQRSIDMPLGAPMNIASYCLLLRLVAKITNMEAGEFTYFMGDAHIYEDQVDLLKEQVNRMPYPSPTLVISEKIKTLKDLETWVTTEDFKINGYEYHPPIKFPFSS